MSSTKAHWTQAHDLALIYLALAYGTDQDLTDHELATITDTLQPWRDDFPADEVQDVVMEALAIFLEDDNGQAVLHAIESLKEQLTQAERERALEDVVRVAEADGILLLSERDLISRVAYAWDMRSTAERLMDQSTVREEDAPAWSLLHDMALMYLVMAHSADNEINEAEIAAMIERLNDWKPELTEPDVRGVLREALTFYSKGPGSGALQRSVDAIRNNLPVVHRLVLLDDLAYVARSDGPISTLEEEILISLSNAWGVGVRMNGKAD